MHSVCFLQEAFGGLVLPGKHLGAGMRPSDTPAFYFDCDEVPGARTTKSPSQSRSLQ